MVDGIGTTVYSYDGAGQLLSEDGPWHNDTVSYSYQNRLRMGMTLQQQNESPWVHRRGQTVETDLGLDESRFGINSLPMPRKVRLEFPGAMYHVMSRGDRLERIEALGPGLQKKVRPRKAGHCCVARPGRGFDVASN